MNSLNFHDLRFIFNLLVSVIYIPRCYATIEFGQTCYSCMSPTMRSSWNVFESIFTKPSRSRFNTDGFTSSCDRNFNSTGMGLHACPKPFPCVTIRADNVVFGIKKGEIYIRGCLSMIPKHNQQGLNSSAVTTHRLNYVTACRHVPRHLLFRDYPMPTGGASGYIHLCTCFDNKCNGVNGMKLGSNTFSILGFSLTQSLCLLLTFRFSHN